MHRNTRQELCWMSPDGDIKLRDVETHVHDLTETGAIRIVQIIPARPGDCHGYGYLALVEIDLNAQGKDVITPQSTQ